MQYFHYSTNPGLLLLEECRSPCPLEEPDVVGKASPVNNVFIERRFPCHCELDVVLQLAMTTTGLTHNLAISITYATPATCIGHII